MRGSARSARTEAEVAVLSTEANELERVTIPTAHRAGHDDPDRVGRVGESGGVSGRHGSEPPVEDHATTSTAVIRESETEGLRATC